MDFAGKKTERVLMRVSEDMAREVRALAELECRSIQDQFRVLIICGLQQAKTGAVNGTNARMRQLVSTRTFASRQPMSTSTFAEESAKELSSTSVNLQRPFPPTRVGAQGRKRSLA
jgi:hypothetical protein